MRWCLVLSLLASMLPALARAQDGGSSVGDAAASFREGGLAFEAGRYEEALGAFRRAYELAPHDRVRFNVAVCLEELGRFREAAVEYEAAAASHQLDEPTRERARAARDAARARLATVSLQSAGAIVEVEIDGAVACATPCEVALDPGEHRVAYTDASGAHERRVRVESGGRLDLVLAEAPALALDVEPAREDAGGIDLGPLGISGIVLFAIGAGGALGFGVRAADVYAEYERAGCTVARCDEGELSRDLANASIALLAAGALAITIDLAFVDD